MFTLDDILQNDNVQFHAQATPDPALKFHAARQDSRLVEPGDLFVALKGEASDGHAFIAAAARAGATAALCSTPASDVPADFLQIVVPDVLKALHITARTRVQHQQGTTLIGITGSNGKTSTKEAAAWVLGQIAPTLKTYASYNNEIGYPLTLLQLEPQHRYAVLEMGAQWVGELAWLCETIARPDWSMVTSVGASHLEHFGSQERVALAKSELVQALTPDGIALLNYDDPAVRAMAEKTSARVLFYGRAEEAEVRATDIGGDPLFGRSFTLHYHGQQQPIQLHIPGEHGVTIALAAAAIACAAHMDLAQIGEALQALLPAKGRGEVKSGPNGSTLIDDSYNANRQSILAITHAMRNSTRAPHGKRWAVLGDIFELGPYAPAEHRAVGEALVGQIDYLVAFGTDARFFVEGALAAGMPQEHIFSFSSDVTNPAQMKSAKQAIADLLLQRVQSDDLVLLKGSRGMGMETIIPMLKKKENIS
jgi:UDP-N-acetylmuramoyl-tripeptide--D-alanyl-D-alanine ligase